MKTWLQTLLITCGITSFFTLLFFITQYESKTNKAQIITHDLKVIHETLKKIHADCEISGFTQEKNPLTFFNVIKFTGSEVGTLNLVNPSRWKGPYIKDNPSIQGIEYQVIRTKDGLFIVPGEGVKLPNGKIIGKDIILDKTTMVEKMLHKEDVLCYKGYCCAKKLNLGSSVIQDLSTASEEFFED